jgi:hypothetical protein
MAAVVLSPFLIGQPRRLFEIGVEIGAWVSLG